MSIDLAFPTLYALRDKAAGLAVSVAGVLTERRRVVTAPAHADDIAASFRAGIDAAAAGYEDRLITYFSDPRLGDVSSLLGPDAASYFMRELMASKAPARVKRYCPGADSGMRQADRQRALRDLDKKLDDLHEQRDEVKAALVLEQVSLRDQRQQAIWDKDWKGQCAVEDELRTLPEKLQAITRDQEAAKARRKADAARV